MKRWIGGLVAVGLLVGAPGVAAQAVTVGGGASGYDLSGTGTSWVASVRVDGVLVPSVRWQAGVGAFRYKAQADEYVTLILPEAGLEWHPPLGPVPLYVGAGAGYDFETNGYRDEFTVYGALGMQIGLASGVALRPELRLRVVDPWTGTMADLGVGVRFGR